MSDISQIALNGVTYNVKDSTARTEAAKKVTASGGDISNTKVAAYTASTASYPVPAAGETPKVFMGKIKKFFEDFISFKDSIVTKTMILNQILNDSTKAASAATVYSVNKRVDDVNSDLAVAIGETSNITSASFTGKIIWQNLGRLTTLSFELTTKKELASGATYELISIAEGIPSKKANCVLTTSDGKPYYCYSSPDGKFYVANYTGAAIPANKVLYGQIAFISA